MTTRAPAPAPTTPDEFVYFCAKCGFGLAKGNLPQPHMTGVCGGCARILALAKGEPFAMVADLTKMPLRERSVFEQKAQEVRRARGIREPIVI